MFDLTKNFMDRSLAMEQPQNLRFRIFASRGQKQPFRVRYIGWREILVPDYKKPAHIRCVLEFECEYIPVIDPNMWFHGEVTQITSSTCVLVVEHIYEYQKLRTGVIMPDIQEVINIAAGDYKSKTKLQSFNMRFALKIPKKQSSNKLLNNSHLELLWCERQKQADEDFAAFEKKLHAKVNC